MLIAERMRLACLCGAALIALFSAGAFWITHEVARANAAVAAATAALSAQARLDAEVHRLRRAISDIAQPAAGTPLLPTTVAGLRGQITRVAQAADPMARPQPVGAMTARDPFRVELFAGTAGKLLIKAGDHRHAASAMAPLLGYVGAFEDAQLQKRQRIGEAADRAVARLRALIRLWHFVLAGGATLAVLLATGLVACINRCFIRPIERIAGDLERLSSGDTSIVVADADHRGVFGALARSVAACQQRLVGHDEALRRLDHAARHDRLTGLPNRMFFAEQLNALIASDGGSAGVALLCLDIDHFKEFNDAVGRAQGDALLCAMAQRLRALCTAGEVVGRTGGDAFAIVQTGLQQPAAAQALAERLLATFEAAGLGASVGIAVFPQHGADEAQLWHSAELALHQAKHDGRGRARLCGASADPGARPSAQAERHALSVELTSALAAGDMRLYYQPKLRSRTRCVDGIEALVRWQHPQRGLIPPDGFVPLAEQSGKIRALTQWTLEQAIADQDRLAAAGHVMPVYVNISGRLLDDPAFARSALTILERRSGVIGLEITETGVISDPQNALAHLHRFVDAGLRIAIDDYGTGMSSLTYLRQLPAHELKIDRSFVSTLSRSHRDPLLVRSTIDLAHALGLEVTAEGVETLAAFELLRTMGCDLIQGYLVARPMPLADLTAFLGQQERLEHLKNVPFQLLNASAW